jgi:hypothetical protein
MSSLHKLVPLLLEQSLYMLSSPCPLSSRKIIICVALYCEILAFHVERYTFRSFPYAWLITCFVTRLTLVDNELVTLPEHMSSPRGLCYSIFTFMCNVLVIVVCSFYFDHCIVCPSLINGFWLPFSIFKLFLSESKIQTWQLYSIVFKIWNRNPLRLSLTVHTT